MNLTPNRRWCVCIVGDVDVKTMGEIKDNIPGSTHEGIIRPLRPHLLAYWVEKVTILHRRPIHETPIRQFTGYLKMQTIAPFLLEEFFFPFTWNSENPRQVSTEITVVKQKTKNFPSTQMFSEKRPYRSRVFSDNQGFLRRVSVLLC